MDTVHPRQKNSRFVVHAYSSRRKFRIPIFPFFFKWRSILLPSLCKKTLPASGNPFPPFRQGVKRRIRMGEKGRSGKSPFQRGASAEESGCSRRAGGTNREGGLWPQGGRVCRPPGSCGRAERHRAVSGAGKGKPADPPLAELFRFRPAGGSAKRPPAFSFPFFPEKYFFPNRAR